MDAGRWSPLVPAVVLVVVVACSDDDTDANNNNSNNNNNSKSNTTQDGGSSGTCANNVLIKSCFAGFMDGCWAPDKTGTCTDTGSRLTWSDGHKIERLGAGAGFYKPGASRPCVAFSVKTQGTDVTITYTKGGKTITDEVKAGGASHSVTCPDGSTFTYTNAEGNASNLCLGVACPK